MNIFETVGLDVSEDNLIETCQNILSLKRLYTFRYNNYKYIDVFLNDFTEIWFPLIEDKVIPTFEVFNSTGSPIFAKHTRVKIDEYMSVLYVDNIPVPTYLVNKNFVSCIDDNASVLTRIGGSIFEGEVFETEEELMSKYGLSEKGYDPVGLKEENINPFVNLCGKVLDIIYLSNPINNKEYCSIQVESIIGVIGLFVDEDVLNRPIKVGDYIYAECFLSSQIIKPFNGSEHIDKDVKNYLHEDINTLKDLFVLVYKSLDKVIADEEDGRFNTNTYPYMGNSANMALIVNEFFDGEIGCIKVGKRNHYFNLIDGEVIDFSSPIYTFIYREIDYSNYQLVSKEDILNVGTRNERYKIFKDRIIFSSSNKKLA